MWVALAAVLRQKTGAERLAIANELFLSARRMLTSFLRTEHPDWDDQQRARSRPAPAPRMGPK